MRESRIALCPESIPGVLPYRFFEAMSAGRVPLLVSSDYVLPFSDVIPYAEFCIFCERDQASQADQIAMDVVRTHNDAEIIAMGRLARSCWTTWLDSTHWPRLMAYAVEKQLKAMGLVCA